jgi:hypothetical protein
MQADSTTPRRSLSPAVAGVALGIAGFVGYFVLVLYLGAWFPGARNHALPSWLLIGTGLALSTLAIARASRGRRLAESSLACLNALLAAAFASLIYVGFVVPGARGPAVGSAAADFALADQTGTVVRLADFAGRPLLLVFYRGHW